MADLKQFIGVPKGNFTLTKEMVDPYNWNKYFNPNYGREAEVAAEAFAKTPEGQYIEAKKLVQNSQAGSAILGQYADPSVYLKGRGPANPGKQWDPNASGSIQQAMQEESALLGKMKGQESAYDTAYTQALQGQEMAKTKTGVFQAGSAPETIIGGAQGAGIEKTGQFKSMYGAGSMLPASWMQSRLDPSAVASKVSGLEDRTAPEQLRVGGGDVGYRNLTYSRSKFAAPTLKKSGLGKYAPLSQLAAL